MSEDAARTTNPDKRSTIERIREALPPEEMLALIRKAVEVGKTDPGPARPVIEELIEVSANFRLAIQAGDLKGAVSNLIFRVGRSLAYPRPWQRDLPTTFEWVKKFCAVAIEIGSQNHSLLAGETPANRLLSFGRIGRHVEGIWIDASRLYRTKSYARGCFLAIACLEEAGKASVSRLHVKLESLVGALEGVTPVPKPDNPFYRHKPKQLLAAAIGARFNQRLEEILGEEDLATTVRMMETGELEVLRKECLYLDARKGKPTFPDAEISEATSRRWVIVAGEVMAEIVGLPDGERLRLIRLVREFEETTH
jgi:AbiV family abortive infection protein